MREPYAYSSSSSSSSATARAGGIGSVSLLGVAFIVLKLAGVISWSWWWVLAPFWAPVGLAAIVVGTALGVALWCAAADGRLARRRAEQRKRAP